MQPFEICILENLALIQMTTPKYTISETTIQAIFGLQWYMMQFLWKFSCCDSWKNCREKTHEKNLPSFIFSKKITSSSQARNCLCSRGLIPVIANCIQIICVQFCSVTTSRDNITYICLSGLIEVQHSEIMHMWGYISFFFTEYVVMIFLNSTKNNINDQEILIH